MKSPVRLFCHEWSVIHGDTGFDSIYFDFTVRFQTTPSSFLSTKYCNTRFKHIVHLLASLRLLGLRQLLSLPLIPLDSIQVQTARKETLQVHSGFDFPPPSRSNQRKPRQKFPLHLTFGTLLLAICGVYRKLTFALRVGINDIASI